MHFTGIQSSPQILLLLKHKTCIARMKASSLIQCIIIEKQSKKKTHDSQIVRDNESLKLSHGGHSQRQVSDSSFTLGPGPHLCN